VCSLCAHCSLPQGDCGGQMGGFSANGGEATKRRLLAIEGLGEQGVHVIPPWPARGMAPYEVLPARQSGLKGPG